MARTSNDTVRMEVYALTVDPDTCLPAVLLVPVGPSATSSEDAVGVPIAVSVGMSEALAIVLELDGIELERPSTHQLMSSLLAAAGVRVDGIEIYDRVGDRLQVRILMTLPDGCKTARESRASDALALALSTGATIEVAADIVAQAKADLEMSCGEMPAPDYLPEYTNEAARMRDMAMLPGWDLDDLGDETFGKWKM